MVDLIGVFFNLVMGIVVFVVGILVFGDIDRIWWSYGFFFFLFMMVGGVLGVFFIGDIFNFYVWFEVLLIFFFGFLIFGLECE